MKDIASRILESTSDITGALNSMFKLAQDEGRVDDALKIGGVIARIKRDAIQVEAHAEAVAHGTAASLGMAHAQAAQPAQGDQDQLTALVSSLGSLAGLREKITGGKVGMRPPVDEAPSGEINDGENSE